jgi:SAM-dependent methyltransferase
MSGYETIPEFGALYDAVPLYAQRADVAFYVAEAERVAGERGGAVLELGCGTGRILLPIARTGLRITGIDESPAMLARCRAKLAAEPPAVRERVALRQADVRDFSAQPPASEESGAAAEPAGFAIAIAPFRVFQHLLTPAGQLACLTTVRRHLVPGGTLVFDVFNPRFDLMTRDRSEETEDTPETPLGDGRSLRRTSRVTGVRWLEQVSDIEIIYYLRSAAGVERIVHAFPMRWYLAAELEHLLVRAGYRVEAMYGGLDRGPLRDGSPEIIVVARTREA